MELSDNARRLETGTITSLTETGMPTEADVLSLATQLRKISIYSVSDEEFDYVIRRLHQALRIDMGLGSRVVDKYTPWLQARKASIDPYYWTRYQLSLRKQGWAPKVVNSLDRVTDEILDLSGNPASHNGWPRRGLVMGDVQSGKTSNYTGLVCKAADAGYRLVILLTGTIESLRRQTQERMDHGFVGLDSSGVVTRNRQRREIGVGLINGMRAAGVFTSTLQDFRVTTVNQLGFKLQAFNEPVLLVVKKHKRILENLTEWLRTFNANADGAIDLPMLLIDDEADNASVNTNPVKATAINSAIRSLLSLFPRSTYVGFTATPFANVFIDPESQEDMLGDDLFPRDFVYALDAPSNYLGAAKIFGDDSPYDCLRKISDATSVFPQPHTADLHVSSLPNSLTIAVLTFFIANAIMDLRRDMPRHRSMLVNVSHYTDVQNQVSDRIHELVRQMQDDIRNYAGLSISDALRNKTMRSLHEIFESEYQASGATWAEVQSILPSSVMPIEVRPVNQKSGASSLSYAMYEQSGLRVIAVGGNSLSRGLTLEGLCISYFYRGTQMYDTLLQMGRWFGYRTGYEDIIRIWMSNDAVSWYEHIAEATEELRREIRYMQVSGLKPIDFGMKVRAHPDSLLITARNKMRNSEAITRVLSISGEGLETPRLMIDPSIISSNYQVVLQTVESIISSTAQRADNGNCLWTNVSKNYIVELLRNFIVHPLNVSFHPVDLAEFIEKSRDPLLADWDVVIPSGSADSISLSDKIAIKPQRRILTVNHAKRYLLVNGKKMRVGSRGVEREGMNQTQIMAAEAEFYADVENEGKTNVPDHAYRKHRSRPLLMLHFIRGEVEKTSFEVPQGTELVALGLSFPILATGSSRVTYRINLVEVRNLLPEETKDDDEELEDDEVD
jgi:hypothetical protein